jgi:23S rRNA (adenine2030-N6)-methyltransferase
MFSYRHAFHAGSHADVLKHMVLIAVLRHLTRKDTALTVVDTHAGAGLYRLDGDYATHTGEARTGVLKLFAQLHAAAPDSQTNTGEAVVLASLDASNNVAKANGRAIDMPTRRATPRGVVTPILQDYLDLVAGFNPDGGLRIYPGSPFVIHRLLRADVRDRLRLFELHPTDARSLAANIAQLGAGHAVTAAAQDGFEALKALLPPPSRRALALIDPSYEIKSDYARVAACVQDGLKRFATGSYLVWYPVIPRPEAHALPRRLRTLANQAGRAWLDAQLSIGQDDARRAAAADPTAAPRRPGLTASGVFVINPPHTLRASLEAALPQLLQILGRGRGRHYTLDAAA